MTTAISALRASEADGREQYAVVTDSPVHSTQGAEEQERREHLGNQFLG